MHFKCELATVFIVLLHTTVSHGKLLDRCEFVHELQHFNPQIDYEELNSWTCIAQFQSNFDTAKLNTDSSGVTYHGIYQISDAFWCSSSSSQLERACKISCDKLHDTFLKDDFECVQKIYAEHQRIHGNPWSAWPIHQQYCSDGRDMIKDCLGEKKSSFVFGKSHQMKDKSKAIAEKKVHKIYERCELAKELHFVHKLPLEQIATWVCIAKHESNYNTSAIGSLNADGSLDHGLFQISDIYWCSPPGTGWVCGLSCAKLENADISDDVICMKKIFDEHQRLSGDGFNAWTTYSRCKQNVDQYTAGCFDSEDTDEISFPMRRPGIFAPAVFGKSALKNKISPGVAKVFSRCELAKELRYKHNLPKDQIHTWVCIAQTLSSLNTAVQAPKNADGSSSYGLFQISDAFWCSVDGVGKGCNAACSDFLDADITNDVQCVQTIFNEHQRLFGNGFHAFAPFEHHCKFETPEVLGDCFGNEVSTALDFPSKPNSIFSSIKPLKVAVKAGKIYERCELAKDLRYKYNLPKDQIHTWICIAQSLSSLNTAVQAPKNADGSSSYGLFQISDAFWCSVDGVKGKGCNAACSDFLDADISNDVQCIQTIFNEHQRLFGNGFHAFAPFEHHCKFERPEVLGDCFGNEVSTGFGFPSKPNSIVSSIKPSKVAAKSGKIYERCELAKELRYVHNIPMEQLSTWVCIAEHESRFDTSAIGRLNADGSADNGLFQISDIYWCSNEGVGKGCNAACSDFRDDDISDDVRCVKKIYEEHQRLFGNGFHAWTVYEPHCRNAQANQLIGKCFPNEIHANQPSLSIPKPVVSVVSNVISNAVGDQGRAYERCELAKELRYRHNVPKDQIADWVCIAQYASNLATSAKGQNSHGLWQISSDFWCSNNGVRGKQCNVDCRTLEDSDITDDYQCARLIYETHQKISGNGWQAWNVWEPYCKERSYEVIAGCFDDISITSNIKSPSPSFTLNINYADNQISNSIGVGETAKKGKIYQRCELAKELRYKYNFPLEQIPTWICIVQRESNFDTAAVGRLNADGSVDNGLFQISDIFWCTNEGVGKGCSASCNSFRDANIDDDVQCIQRIFDEHQRLFGNGFHAWTTWERYCTAPSPVDDCFANVEPQKVENITKKTIPSFVPFTTTTTTTTTRKPPTTIAATLTPLSPFKYSTFAPFSLFTPTQPTTKYPTATAQFVSYYTTSTTKRPSFAPLPQFTTKSTPIPTTTTTIAPLKLNFATAFPAFGAQIKPNPIAPTKNVNQPSFAAVYNNYFTTTTTTPKPLFSFIQPASFAKVPTIPPPPTTTTKKSTPNAAFAFTQSFGFPHVAPTIPSTTTAKPFALIQSPQFTIPKAKTTTSKPPTPAFVFNQPFTFEKTPFTTRTTTTTTPKPFTFTQALGFPKLPSIQTTTTTTTTPKPTFAPFVQPAGFVNQPVANKITATSAPFTSSSKFNIFDLYLSGLTTKAPAPYSIPTIPALPKQPITFANPYTARYSPTASPSYTLNTYSLPDNYIKVKPSTSKPTDAQVQSQFQLQIAKISRSLGVNASYLPPSVEQVQTTKKPKRVFRYSFSGLTSPQ